MKDVLNSLTAKTVRIYTMSGVKSYLGIIEDVREDYVVLKSFLRMTEHTSLFSILKA